MGIEPKKPKKFEPYTGIPDDERQECITVTEPSAEKITPLLRTGYRLVAVTGVPGSLCIAWLVRGER